jgi:hypothetical protein
MIGPFIVYLLCALTSLGCTLLLIGRYRKTRVDLLFWSALAFLAFTITNALLFIDLAVVPGLDLALLRNGFTFVGVMVLLYGLIQNNT